MTNEDGQIVQSMIEDYIKNNLRIELEQSNYSGEDGVTELCATVYLEDEVVSETSVFL